jgi:hypothetical protein
MVMREANGPTEGRPLYTLSVVLFAAIDAEAVSIDDIRAWADRQILEAQVAPAWLIDLSISTTRGEAARAVLGEMEKRFMLPGKISDVLLGLTYVRYKRREITRDQLVSKVGEIMDAYEASLMEMNVERWYGQMTGESSIPRAQQAMLDNLAAKAEAALTRLLDTKTAADDKFWE